MTSPINSVSDERLAEMLASARRLELSEWVSAWTELTAFRASRRSASNTAGGGVKVETEWVVIPKAALEWLNGAAPDPAGYEFGEFPEDHPKPPGAFWWRRTFKDICDYYERTLPKPALSTLQAGGEPVALYGPYGWLNGHRGLSEDSWNLESDPLENNEEYFAIPLYAKVDPFVEVGRPATRPATPVSAEVTERDQRQSKVAEWCAAAFGAEHQASVPQRGLRMLEEAIEAYQATTGNAETAHRLIDYIFAKEPGELRQELGGVGITVLALAAAAGLSADDAEAAELARVLAKPLAWFHARNKVKNEAGFDATAYPSSALATLDRGRG